ncbi:MAG: tRNA (adenosine(37)-N6)-dimethylallyltransferase MiaA [Alphaproteobacteria bacterium]|nr:tRNA (adenosine(37)-N6)-dimethylallyltransferase MiaA [Alphaproteobacteria bacterium]
MLILAGPTAAGKTATAVEVARRFDAVIVSADAMQVYRGMDVGTAKVTPEEQAGVPHFGIDVVDPRDPFDAAAFVALAEAVLATHPRVVVAGGTSLYLRSLVRGLVPTPPVDPALREELEAIEDLHGELRRVDPELAERLHPNDRVRLVRGLEVFRQTGERMSELQRAHAAAPDRHAHVGLWLDRPDLFERIDRRVESMMAAGYLDEVRRLLDDGVGRDLKPMQSLGYRHLCDHLLDGLPLDEAVRRTARDTRHFARKQRTWMRQLGYPRVEPPHLDEALRAAARAFTSP